MSVLCPQLAKEPRPIIITVANAADVTVSTLERVSGTKVTLACFVPSSFTLSGSRVLTCLDDGSWDEPTPTCVPRQPLRPSPFSTTAFPSPSELTMLPYFVGLGLAAMICLLLAVIMCCAAHYWKQEKEQRIKRKSSPRIASLSAQDYKHATLDGFYNDSWRLRPFPMDSYLVNGGGLSPVSWPSWFAMLPQKDDLRAPYI